MRRTVRRLVRSIHLAVRLFHFPFIPESVLPLHLCVALSRSVHFLFERQRSPAAHLVRRTVRRLVRRIHLAVWLFHFPFIPESVLPLYLCVALSRSVHFLFERQRSPSAHFVRRSGGTPCWIPFSLAVPGFALRNRSRVVRDLSFTVVEGPLNAQ